MRYAIYARVSTDAQSQNSTTDQIHECRVHGEKEGWIEAGVYVDEAISGSDISRKEYARLKTDALSGNFEYIIVDDLSRIGRDMPEFTKLFQELTEIGVYLVGVGDGIDTSKPSSKLPVYFKGIINEIFLDDLKAKVVRGLKGQFLRGYSTGGRVYGYISEPELDPMGGVDKFGRPKIKGCRIVVVPEEAEVVRRIFDLRLSGLGYRAIANVLNSEGIASPHSKTAGRSGYWCSSTIRTILMNRKYTGRWVYNKTRWVKKRINGKRKAIKNNPTDWVEYQSEELRTITDELFFAVNSGIKQGQNKVSSGKKKYLLSGLVKCSHCGGSMVAQNSGKYSCFICNNARSRGAVVCKSKSRILRADVEKSVLSEISRVFFNDATINEITRRANWKVKSYYSTSRIDVAELKHRRKAIQSQIDNLLNLVENGKMSQALRVRLEKREWELQQIEIDVAKADQSPENVAEISADLVRQRLDDLKAMVANRQDSTILLRNELRNLFPEKLSITPLKVGKNVGYKITGAIKPFGLFSAGNVSICLAAVRGIEPRFDG